MKLKGQMMKKRKPKVNKMKMKANETRNELKASDSNTYQLKTEERMKNGGISSWNHPRKHLERVTEAPWLGFSSRNQVFSLKTPEIHNIGVRDAFYTTPFPYL